MFTRTNPDEFKVKDLEDQIEQLKHDHEMALNAESRRFDRADRDHAAKVTDLQAELSRTKDLHANELKRVSEKHSKALDRTETTYQETIEDLEARLEALQELGNTHQENVTTGARLDSERAVFEAEKAAFGNIKTAVADARSEGRAQAEAEYNKGYADGVADGIRKIYEVTAADRSELVKIANKAMDNYEPAELPALPAPQVIIAGQQVAKGESKK